MVNQLNTKYWLNPCFGFVLVMMFFWACSEKNAPESSKDELYPYAVFQAVPFSEVKIKDSFWSPKIDTIAQKTLPLVWNLAKAQGRMENFKIVAGLSDKEYAIRNSPDAPVHKLIEAAAYTLTNAENPGLEAAIDSIIHIMELAQSPNGYLHTQFMLDKDDPRAPTKKKAIKTFGFGKEDQWKSAYTEWPHGYSQLFTAGHMFEAAVAYYRATGKKSYLEMSIKLADHLLDKFQDEEFLKNYADHPEVEIGLMKLYEVTGKQEYVGLANRISRHVKFVRPVDLNKEQAILPLDQQREAFGHCVRTAYVYSGATDVVMATGDKELEKAMHSLWDNIVGKKMYIHGGTGNGSSAEQHGFDYDLPIYPTYSECCANIAQGQWNHRMNLLTGNAKYADLLEHEMYNAALSGISLDGQKFFYSNKLNVGLEGRKGKHGGVRETYFFCCPSKLPSFVSGIGKWIYAKSHNTLVVNQYVGSKLVTRVGKDDFRMKMKSAIPWEGSAELTIEQPTSKEMTLKLRVPSWVRSNQPFQDGLYYFERDYKNQFAIMLNGTEMSQPKIEEGYISITKKWKKGDQVTIYFNMPIRKVLSDPKLVFNKGRVALMRGPLLYCLEGADNHFDVTRFVLNENQAVEAGYDDDLLGGTVVLTGLGSVADDNVNFKAIPYFLWQNRGIHKMATLLIRNPKEIYQEDDSLNNEHNTNG
ncbi:glycoside hydrolase family 127 protein [Echinicola shivajiensis]|uniref:glycoside hydrolase family 127 protein n=1 Tax=Echinicola shivajiensis TaxID=1035916 RepID=UPI001BFC943D|nr:beta-L-arabinofuranosidase domain-containing protein [Echinicola shivajiensis]